MHWLILVLVSAAILIASLGLIALLFAEIVWGRRRPEARTATSANSSAAWITDEERASLTDSRSSEKFLSRTSSTSQGKIPPASNKGRIKGDSYEWRGGGGYPSVK